METTLHCTLWLCAIVCVCVRVSVCVILLNDIVWCVCVYV